VIPDTGYQQVEFPFQHAFQPGAGDIAPICGFAVDLVAELHVVGRHGLCHRAGGGAGLEEPAGNFLARADFHDRAVFQGIEIDRQCFFDRAGDLVRHGLFHLLCSTCHGRNGRDVTSVYLRYVTEFLLCRGCDSSPAEAEKRISLRTPTSR